MLARQARYTLGHRHELRSHGTSPRATASTSTPRPGRRAMHPLAGFAFCGRPGPAAAAASNRRHYSSPAGRGRLEAAASKGACGAGGHVCRPAGQADRIRTPIVFRYAVDRSGRARALNSTTAGGSGWLHASDRPIDLPAHDRDLPRDAMPCRPVVSVSCCCWCVCVCECVISRDRSTGSRVSEYRWYRPIGLRSVSRKFGQDE